MSTRSGLLGVGLPILVLAGLSWMSSAITGAEDKAKKALLPEPVFDEAIKDATKLIQDGLEGKPSEKTAAAQVRTNAVIIDLLAADLRKRPGADAELVDVLVGASMKLREAAAGTKINLDEAKKQADILARFPKVKLDAPFKFVPYEIDDVMNVFAKLNKGGRGFEVDLINLSNQRKPFTPNQLSDRVVMNAYLTALVADLLIADPFEQGKKKNKEKEWQGWSADMKKNALDVIQMAKARKMKEGKDSVKKLYGSCVACHEVFKKN